MKAIYKVRGMTCDGCAESIKENLESSDFIISANVNLNKEKVYIEANRNFSLSEANSLIDNLGEYKIFKESFISKIIQYFYSKKNFISSFIYCDYFIIIFTVFKR